MAERAYQNRARLCARARAKPRIGQRQPRAGEHHPPPHVRRMLLVQKATLAAQRALYMQAASAIDLVHGLEDPVVRKQASARLII